jgi:hypothetical protein
MLALDFDTAIPGHGPVSTRADVEKWRADLVGRRHRLRTMLKPGSPWLPNPARGANHFSGRRS